jgi:nitrogen-specific signal transduction histidine kinase/CheY-like chemotaxis protein
MSGSDPKSSNNVTNIQNDSTGSPYNLSLLFENMINAFVVWESVFDDEGRYISFRFGYFNNAYAKISDLRLEDVKGKDIMEVWPGTEPEWIKIYGEVAVSGITKTFDMYHQPTKGWYHCNAYRPSSSPSMICVIFEDITEKLKAEGEKEKLRIHFLQTQKIESIGRLAEGVAHDFNNMLNVILVNAEYAVETLAKDHPAADAIHDIFDAARHSADLTHQLLTFARKQPTNPYVIDLNETVEGMIKMLTHIIGESIKLIWIPHNEPCISKIDPSQINQVLINLVMNSRDATSSGGQIIIKTGLLLPGEDWYNSHPDAERTMYTVLSVTDSGHGMDDITLGNLFEPFFTTKPEGKGTGMGLSTVYGIVKQNNGYISVESEPGKGTSFTLYFTQHCKTLEEENMHPNTPPLTGSETILLVEDESSLLKVTTIMLTKLGYTVLPAASPEQAIRIAKNNKGKIHLILTDMVMPEMNGKELAEKLCTEYPSIKILFMSGYTPNIININGEIVDQNNFIEKPFSSKSLAAKIRDILDTH